MAKEEPNDKPTPAPFPVFDDDDDDDDETKFKIFGTDFSKIPCFRESLLYGIGGGVGAGFASFLFTSNVPKSTNIGFGSYLAGTLAVWIYCRYKWAEAEFNRAQFQKAIQHQLLTEGTELEQKIKDNVKAV